MKTYPISPRLMVLIQRTRLTNKYREKDNFSTVFAYIHSKFASFHLTISSSHSPSMTNSKAQLWQKSRAQRRRTGGFMETERSPHSIKQNSQHNPHANTSSLGLKDQPSQSLRPLSLVNICCAPHNQKKTEEPLKPDQQMNKHTTWSGITYIIVHVWSNSNFETSCGMFIFLFMNILFIIL